MVILSVILPLKESGRLWNLYEREWEHKKERKERQWVHRDEHMHREIFTLLQCLHMYVKPMVHNINTIWNTHLFLDAKMHVNEWLYVVKI